MKEVWKDIQGYEGLYQVSNCGRIKSLIKNEKILKPGKVGKYYHVTLRKNNASKNFYVHRLVGSAFINNFKNFSDINHKDGNTANNNVDNLEWCTRSENIKHAYRILKRKISIEGLEEYREKNKKKINQYDLQGNYIKTWTSISEAEKYLKVTSIGKICMCCKNKRKSAFGYKWKYFKE